MLKKHFSTKKWKFLPIVWGFNGLVKYTGVTEASKHTHTLVHLCLKEIKLMANQINLDMLLSRVTDVMSKANKHKISFFEHAYLWTDSRTEFMHYFLTYGRQITPEEMEALVTQ